MILFLYGTLLDPARLARIGGVPGLRLRPARLHGRRRVRMRGGPFPTLVRAFGATVLGAIARIPAAALPRLQAYEGSRYVLVPVVARCGNRPVLARSWIAPGTRLNWSMKEA